MERLSNADFVLDRTAPSYQLRLVGHAVFLRALIDGVQVHSNFEYATLLFAKQFAGSSKHVRLTVGDERNDERNNFLIR